MSFYVQFFARDVAAARAKLAEAFAPAAVKAIVELAIAGIPHSATPTTGIGQQAGAAQVANGASEKVSTVNRAPPAPVLRGILVETQGHIDESGNQSSIDHFRVRPFYD